MIKSFKDKGTEDIYNGKNTKDARKLAQGLHNIASRKLDYIQSAVVLSDLSVPPGNRLEALSGDLKGYQSIRINDQWRIVFKWTDDGAEEVQVTDYH